MKIIGSVFSLACAALVTAQTAPSIPSTINQCGQKCINDLFSQAQYQMGCTDLAASCICQKGDFLNGIRDCSQEACGADVKKLVLNWYYSQLCSKRPSTFRPAPTPIATSPSAGKTVGAKTKTGGGTTRTTQNPVITAAPTTLKTSATSIATYISLEGFDAPEEVVIMTR